MYGHNNFVRLAFGLDERDTRLRVFIPDGLSQFEVLLEVFPVMLIGVPFRLPIADDADSKTRRMYFPSH